LQFSRELYEIQFDELEQLQEIGGAKSSAAIVFKAIWKKEQVAVKLFRTNYFSSAHEFEEFEHELKLLGVLKHPNIVSFYGACLKVPRVGIVLEYCCNGSLANFIEKNKNNSNNNNGSANNSNSNNKKNSSNSTGKLTWEFKVKTLLNIARGMRFLHNKNVIHRDLKAENVLIDENLIAKITDFGLSRTQSLSDARMTRNVGTSFYIAPEVINDEFYNEKCDVFAFGIIMFELLVETLKPYGSDMRNVELRVASNPTFRPVIPDYCKIEEYQEWYIDLMQTAWKHNPEKRPSMDEIVTILEAHEHAPMYQHPNL